VPDVVLWALVIIGLAWAIFTIVVMVAVLRAANEVYPYYKRMNEEYRDEYWRQQARRRRP
jgi:hypothetical protein